MKKCFYSHTLLLLLLLVTAPTVTAQINVTPDTQVETQKRGQTGLKFLSNSVDARATALGGAVMADMVGSSTSLFYNPASMAGMPGNFHVGLGLLEFITDINYNIASIAYRPQGGNYGVVGLSIISVDYGEFLGTIRANNESGFVDTGAFSPSALAVGIGYARSFTDRFAAGVHIKYALQDIGSDFVTSQDFSSGQSLSTESYDINTVAFDFGVVYSTGFRSLTLGFSARNFSQELTYVRENFELPLTFQFGISMNLMDLTSLDPNVHNLTLHADATRPRDFNEHVKLGLEYSFQNIIFLRGGMAQIGVSDEEQGINLGAGLHYQLNNISFGADYTYTDFGIFGSVNRVSLQLGL